MYVDVKAIVRKLPLRKMSSDLIIMLTQNLVSELICRASENGYWKREARLQDMFDGLQDILNSVNIDEPMVDLDKEKWDNYYRDNPVD